MALEVVRGQQDNYVAGEDLADVLASVVHEGTLYLGYPVLATADDRVEIDALLVSKSHGLIAFRFSDRRPASESDWTALSDEQDRIFNVLESHLSRHESLRRGRKFLVDIIAITVLPASDAPGISTDSIFASMDELAGLVQEQAPVAEDTYRKLEAALQRVTTIRPAKRRAEVVNEDSRGATMKIIESGIANLDFWQKRAAIETPDGPQRIRGLAGSGKTIVLALKAALLHAQNENWVIGVTFWSQSLYQQFEDLIKRFSFAHMDDLPDPERLMVMHAWGSRAREGIYMRIADALGVTPSSFAIAERKYGRDEAFAGICTELLDVARRTPVTPIFDALLIDEAQDLPDAFFQLIYMFTKDPKRVVWAYDELQKLDEAAMSGLSDMFGVTASNDPLVTVENREGEPRRDIVLPVCYRNTPWALATAHAVGFGIYRDGGLVQHFDDPRQWEVIGYQRNSGALSAGSTVELERSTVSTPQYFADRLTSEDAVVIRGDFADEEMQDKWVAQQILNDIGPGELEHDDILLVLPSAYTSKKRYARLARVLDDAGIPSHLVGVGSSRDEVFVRGSVAVAHIYRAKGNEAPMVYVLDAQYAGAVFNEVTRRNTIFTAITRSKAWVRVCGYGPGMDGIAAEVEAVRAADFKLRFKIPTTAELADIRRVNADQNPGGPDTTARLTLEELAGALARKEISPEQLPPKLVRQIAETFSTISLPDDDA